MVATETEVDNWNENMYLETTMQSTWIGQTIQSFVPMESILCPKIYKIKLVHILIHNLHQIIIFFISPDVRIDFSAESESESSSTYPLTIMLGYEQGFMRFCI